jgi:hypothetical protein
MLVVSLIEQLVQAGPSGAGGERGHVGASRDIVRKYVRTVKGARRLIPSGVAEKPPLLING